MQAQMAQRRKELLLVLEQFFAASDVTRQSTRRAAETIQAMFRRAKSRSVLRRARPRDKELVSTARRASTSESKGSDHSSGHGATHVTGRHDDGASGHAARSPPPSHVDDADTLIAVRAAAGCVLDYAY